MAGWGKCGGNVQRDKKQRVRMGVVVRAGVIKGERKGRGLHTIE